MSQRIVPTWAPRVAQWKIRRLYEADVRGIYDEDLINEVGYSLLARGESFVQAVDAVRGKARCPCCSAVLEHSGREADLLPCGCGWELTWGEYFQTIQLIHRFHWYYKTQEPTRPVAINLIESRLGKVVAPYRPAAWLLRWPFVGVVSPVLEHRNRSDGFCQHLGVMHICTGMPDR